MKLKAFVILVFSLFSLVFIHAQETMIDSVYSSALLDGTIFYRESTQQLEISTISGNLFAGDTGLGPNADPNSRWRSYISFELPIIPEGYSIDSVLVRLFQFISYGNGEQGVFPVWNVAGGDTMYCIMDHIDYGNTLDSVDWTAGDPGDPQTLHTNIGVISDSPEYGFHYLNITGSVLDDYTQNRIRSQFRVRFPIETDWDYSSDWITFGANSGYIGAPIIFIYYSQNSDIDDIELVKDTHILNVYPNPFNPSGAGRSPKTTISYQIPYPGIIKLQIFNIAGQLIETLVDEYQNEGKHSVIWNAENYSSGVYLYRINAGAITGTGKCLLLK
ncbi:MAG: T9SS type A sorting domain-containing protein [Candidatus Cloacimonetes bacterium]|nr:T9SS type A sorting domain-containing protein [Candidatus Cloacimonadota bacterium]